MYTLPANGSYLGNAWICPTSGTTPSNNYVLFQAQDNASHLGAGANPGTGLDNQVWLYRPTDHTAWQLTFYTELSTGTTLGGGVLGPQCSEDSDSSTNTLHIVYAHIIQAPPVSFGCSSGPSNGMCAWFGQFELVYADINFSGGNPDCSGTGETPCFTITHGAHVNPRDNAAVPYGPVTGIDGVVSHTSCGTASYKLTASENFAGTPAGAGIRLGTSAPYYYSIVSSVLDPYDLCLQDSIPAGTYTFNLQNMNLMEPHRYVSDGGDLYYSTNSLYILHDSAGARFNVTTGALQILNQTYPPGTTPPGMANAANTWFNEFLTPVSASATTPSPKPLGRAIFMSDLAVNSTKFSLLPEYSDHYMCGPPNCQLPVRMTEFNNADGSQGADSSCSGCFPTVAVRGAWSPLGNQYLTMTQYVYSSPPPPTSYAQLHLFTLQFPQVELGGHAVISGHAQMK